MEKKRSTDPRRLLLWGGAFVALGGLLAPTAVANAEPEPTREEVEQKIEELLEETSTLVQDYNEAEEVFEAAEAEVEDLEGQIGAEEEVYAELRRTVGELASASYQSNDPESVSAALFVDNPAEIFEQAADLSYLSEASRRRLEDFAESDAWLIALKEEAEIAYDEAEEQLKEVEKNKEETEEALTEQEELLAAFDGDNPTTAGESPSAGGSVPTYTGSASGNARTAIEFAYSKIGVPYLWGGTGPNGYDCSGLTQASWAAAGVSIPRTTYSQWELPNAVAWEDIQPGDILFFFPDLGHNGLYVGNGMMVHAPSSGKTISEVRLADYWAAQFVGARRP
ncbi:NlpC/P60 family protein [Nocardiopsis dassonvillei]|uniref:C40 family peptidase n=1 Tax=Nocardiopsis dassonvillei TaxID=2014 RepID=UPI00200F161C|nr:NlpC/P60 family protein [Nocardiopsis dassonvillei]MCK9871395.1 NlpC/P60 family protein [Nocardiopsis dassonvillei]